MDTPVSSIVFFVALSTVVLLVLAGMVVNLLLISRNRRLKHRNEVLEMKTSFEKELMKTQVEVAEHTLNDIARDLHDDVGQMLTLSIIQLNNLKDEHAPTSSVDQVRETVQSTLHSVRSLSKTLSNDYITSFGIRDSLNRLFERLNKQRMIKAELSFPDEVVFHSKPSELFVFRIIQELVSNTLKHAGATKIYTGIIEVGDVIEIDYRDNGKGMDIELLKSGTLKSSLGYVNIFHRVEMLKGNITIPEISSEGFYFRFSIPNIGS